ncbi:MAG TPA: sodium transporter, partial [Puia sp.]|nr:sodium transporter [Puia sp.]
TAALTGSILTIPVSTILKFLPVWTHGAFPDYPFLDRMTITFVIIVLIMIGISFYRPAANQDSHTIVIDKKDFRVSPAFILGSVIIMGILTGLYTAFW